MDGHLQPTSPWWLIASLLTVCSHSKSGMAFDFVGYRVPSRFEASAAERQHTVDPGEPPRRAVLVKCHADSMEVAVQADMFDTGLLVEAKHLRLGSDDSASAWSECGAVPSGEAEFTIQAHLMACGTKLSVSFFFAFYAWFIQQCYYLGVHAVYA